MFKVMLILWLRGLFLINEKSKSEINKKLNCVFQNVLSYEHCLINCRSEINEKLTCVFENVWSSKHCMLNCKSEINGILTCVFCFVKDSHQVFSDFK